MFIKNNKIIPNLELTMERAVADNVSLCHKQRLNGLGKDTEVKKIVVKSDVDIFSDGYKVDLNIDIQYYSNCTFDINTFLADLTSRLDLVPGSIKLIQNDTKQNYKKTVVRPVHSTLATINENEPFENKPVEKKPVEKKQEVNTSSIFGF